VGRCVFSKRGSSRSITTRSYSWRSPHIRARSRKGPSGRLWPTTAQQLPMAEDCRDIVVNRDRFGIGPEHGELAPRKARGLAQCRSTALCSNRTASRG
jgi:hypothetical protein